MKKWKVLVINHSHTDIGYTDRQEKIMRYHYDFIRQAIHIFDQIHTGSLPNCKGYKWQCENFWQVRNFYSFATEQEKQSFEKYVRQGEIAISGNYLNLTELIDHETLSYCLSLCKEYADNLGVAIDCGMSADINGFSWGYVDDLYESGIRNFYSALHPHHGMFPLYKKVLPFWWESPKGKRILFWNGEYYHFGNEMFLAPYGGSSYLCLDEFHKDFWNNTFFNKNQKTTLENEMRIGKIRLTRYLNNLEHEGYPLNIIPMLVSGAITDNGFPSAAIMERINQYNSLFEGTVTFQMSTLDEFFSCLRNSGVSFPVYKGDWNDWWADGVGSTPAAVQQVKSAQRKLDLCKKLDPSDKYGDKNLVTQAKDNIMLYCEHTWGYSSSVSEPWNALVSDLECRKTAYAVNANIAISKNLDAILAQKGECSIHFNRPHHYTVINPHSLKTKMPVHFFVEKWEYIDGLKIDNSIPLQVIDLKTGTVVPHQIVQNARAYEIEIVVELDPLEECEFELRIDRNPKQYVVENHPYIGADGIMDIPQKNEFEINTHIIETNDFKLEFSQQQGLVRMIDKKGRKELIYPSSEYSPFTGIYEMTEMHGEPIETRRKMGRNRKSEATRRCIAKLSDMHIVSCGSVFSEIELDYSLEGTKLYSVFLKVYHSIAQIDASVRIHKTSVWDPENLYVSLPFSEGDNEEVFIDKTSCFLRPGIDQLPGTNDRFYLLQNGVVFQGEKNSLVLSMKDTPLVTFGSLESSPVTLCPGNCPESNRLPIYSWVMNNYWETNFNVNLAGFYEFNYSLKLLEKKDISELFNQCQTMNEGLISFNSEKRV